MFYCYRVAILTKSKYAVGAIAAVREKAARNCVELSHNFQLSIAQLGAAIATALQARAAVLIINILGTKISLITIGVCFSQHTSLTIFPAYHTCCTRFGQGPPLAAIQQ